MIHPHPAIIDLAEMMDLLQINREGLHFEFKTRTVYFPGNGGNYQTRHIIVSRQLQDGTTSGVFEFDADLTAQNPSVCAWEIVRAFGLRPIDHTDDSAETLP